MGNIFSAEQESTQMAVSKALKFRLFLRTLFGSRLIEMLETASDRERVQYDLRLQERDITISDLRSEIAQLKSKIERYELVVIPLTSPGANILNPQPPPSFTLSTEPAPGSWAAIQAEHARKQDEESAAETAAKEGVKHGVQE